MSSVSSTPRALGPTKPKKAGSKTARRSKREAPPVRERTYEEWYEGELMRVANAGKLVNEPIEVFTPMPLIRCTMPVPCGVCWYCKSHDQNRRSP